MPQEPTNNTARWLALTLGVGLLLVGLSMRFAPVVWDGQRWLASDSIGKIGLMLLSMWVAWPGIEAIRRAPGGPVLLVACGFVFLLFLQRPKTLLFTGPFIAIAIGIEIGRAHV